jgi:hypothetical protein
LRNSTKTRVTRRAAPAPTVARTPVLPHPFSGPSDTPYMTRPRPLAANRKPARSKVPG